MSRAFKRRMNAFAAHLEVAVHDADFGVIEVDIEHVAFKAGERIFN